jgi:hypothetical protein
MTAEQIRKAQEQRPFRPYRLHLSDQRSFLVPHPEFLWLVPGGRNLAVADTAGAVEIIDLIHVTSLGIDGLRKKTR